MKLQNQWCHTNVPTLQCHHQCSFDEETYNWSSGESDVCRTAFTNLGSCTCAGMIQSVANQGWTEWVEKVQAGLLDYWMGAFYNGRSYMFTSPNI